LPSHPAWDAWIETHLITLSPVLNRRRIPHGMRGLKPVTGMPGHLAQRSHPAWDAWIET